MTNFLATQNPTGQVTQLVTANGSETVISAPGGGGGGGIPTPATSHIVFASPVFGSDTTGDGTEGLPYATIAKAYSTITTASATGIWQVVLFAGEYTENVALKPFVRLEGWDKAKQTSQVYPARINGTVTLDAGFSATGATAWVTAIDIDGTTTLDFVAATSADGSVSFTGCQFEVNVALTQGPQNSTELHECTLLDNFVQQGGSVTWENTVGAIASSLQVEATTGAAASGALFAANNSCWIGSVQVDANGNVTDAVEVDLINSQFRGGLLTIAVAGSNVPVVNGAYGATLENPVLVGSASVVKLSPQMRVVQQLTIPSGVLIESLSNNDVPISLAASVLGATSIEDMSCMFTPIGGDWSIELSQHQVSWSFYVKQNGATSEVHVCLFNPSATPQTTATDLFFNFAAYLPEPSSP
jgi:hypothetical protein